MWKLLLLSTLQCCIFYNTLAGFLWASFSVLLFCFVRWCRQYLDCSYFRTNLGWVHCFFPFPPCLSFLHNLQLHKELWWCHIFFFFYTALSDLLLPLSDCFDSANRLYLPVVSHELSRVSRNRLLYQYVKARQAVSSNLQFSKHWLAWPVFTHAHQDIFIPYGREAPAGCLWPNVSDVCCLRKALRDERCSTAAVPQAGKILSCLGGAAR